MSERFVHSNMINTKRCKICGDFARYSYFGVVVCQPCKMFFKRNAQFRREYLTCRLNNTCDINVNSRQICSACRMKKCFANGMLVELIRNGHGKKKERYRKDYTSTSLVVSNNRNRIEQISPLNLLQSDQSTLSIDQWNLLSNLVHCFDEYSGCFVVERYIEDQNALPTKLRFKFSSVKNFLTTTKAQVQFVFENNRDFLSLSPHDRAALLRTIVKYTSGIGSMFMVRRYQLFNYASFFSSIEMIFRSTSIPTIRRAIDQLDSDDTFIKLMLAIVATSTRRYTIYTKLETTNLINPNAILSVQNIYVELAWRYALYKYGEYDAVRRFSNLVRCLLCISDAVAKAQESQQYTQIIDTVVQQIEQDIHL